MLFSYKDIMDYVDENDVKFIRLVFFDIFGNMKNISIMDSELSRALENGIAFDASEISGFMNIGESDLLLFPDPSTAEILPWRPQQSRVLRLFCDIRYPDGKPFEGDSRHILKSAVKNAKKAGYNCEIGSECEFYLFNSDEYGNPTLIPHDYGTFYDVAPVDKGENVRREICLTLEEMGIAPQSSHHEKGPGQHEIVFRHSAPVEAADHLMTFKNLVKTIASINGLFASFMPRPLKNQSGNGLHMNISIYKGLDNVSDIENETAKHFIAGVLRRTAEMTLILNPLTNSYARFGQHQAPKYVSWSVQNRQQLIRIPSASSSSDARIELRSPDPSCNPYLGYALLISAGLEGIKDGLELVPPINVRDKDNLSDVEPLPKTLEEAVNLAENSKFLRNVLPESIIDTYVEQKRLEWLDYKKAVDKDQYETNQYFSAI